MEHFTESQACKAQIHCKTCRARERGRSWRKQLMTIFKFPNNNIDFDCPFGYPWEYKGRPDNALCYVNPNPGKLGASWAFINWVARKSVATKQAIKIGHDQLVESLLPLLDLPVTIEIGEGSYDPCEDNVYLAEYYPTKIRWVGGSKIIIYKFTGTTFNSYIDADKSLDSLKQAFPDYTFISFPDGPLEDALKQCVTAACYISISTGPAHLMHSFGIPMFLVNTPPADIKFIHLGNSYVYCANIAEAITKMNDFLTTGIYSPKNYLHMMAKITSKDAKKGCC